MQLKKIQKILMALGMIGALLIPLGACTVEQTEEGEMPEADIEVEAEEGELPEYDVDAADVEVGTEEKEVTVPDVDIEPPEEDEDDEGDDGGDGDY